MSKKSTFAGWGGGGVISFHCSNCFLFRFRSNSLNQVIPFYVVYSLFCEYVSCVIARSYESRNDDN